MLVFKVVLNSSVYSGIRFPTYICNLRIFVFNYFNYSTEISTGTALQHV